MIRKSLIILISIILLSSILFAEENLILDINIEGNRYIETELIQSLLPFEVGDFLTLDKTSKAIKNLYQIGVFNNIEITTADISRGLSVTIIVQEFPLVSDIKFTGNKKIGKRKLKDTIEIQKGSYWSPFAKQEVANKIKEEYKLKGYHLITVDFSVKEVIGTEVEVIVSINEGHKVKIKKIKINGNKLITSKKLLGKLKTKRQSLLRSGKFDQEKFDEDLIKIVEYYNKKGFIDAHVISYEKKIQDGHYYIDIYLFEGNPYYFGSVFTTGNTKFEDKQIISNFKFEKDDVFNLPKYEKFKQNVNAMYYEEGYIYSVIEEELEKEGERVNIKLNISENVRAKVRKILLTGNRKTKEKVIRRHLAIAPGDYFQQSRVMKSQQNIYNMGFFEPDITLDYQPINSNGDIDLTIKMNDKSSGSANGGIALNSQDGLVGQLAISHNNIFGNSWQAGVKWEFGGKTQNYDFNFTNPYFKDSSTLLGFNLYHTKKIWDTYSIFTNGASVRVGRPLSFLNYSKIITGYSFYQKKYEIDSGIDEEDISETLEELSEKGWQNTSSMSLTISRDSRDNYIFPTSGSDFTLYSEIAGGPLGGDFNYFKQIAQVSWFSKTFWEFALKVKWRMGFVTGYNGKVVPPDERFYLGGTGPDGIRGYADRSVGPREGGLREILFSTEYGFPVAGDQIVSILFFDAGDSYDKFEEFNFWDLKKGVGTGIRIQSPFGLIGFDYAYNLASRRWEPHFQFGTTF
ncbi:MAG: outer membrane protein assembly factor BamA [Candidatus Cloacimonetes bacterium]|nr:outer membrane protein assembly factor BamA [Candidatus Cloacimonadota bacterium]